MLLVFMVILVNAMMMMMKVVVTMMMMVMMVIVVMMRPMIAMVMNPNHHFLCALWADIRGRKISINFTLQLNINCNVHLCNIAS